MINKKVLLEELATLTRWVENNEAIVFGGLSLVGARELRRMTIAAGFARFSGWRDFDEKRKKQAESALKDCLALPDLNTKALMKLL